MIIATSCSAGDCLPSSVNPATPPAVATPTPATKPVNSDLFMNDPPWFEPTLCGPFSAPAVTQVTPAPSAGYRTVLNP